MARQRKLSDGYIHPTRLFDKKGLAAFMGVTIATVDQWIAKGAPYRVYGEKGVSWEFDCLAVHDWREGRGEKPVYGPDIDPDQLPTLERKVYFEAELRRRDLDERDGKLIPADAHRTALADACKLVVAQLESLPDSLEKKGLPPHQVETVEQTINGLRQALYESMIG